MFRIGLFAGVLLVLTACATTPATTATQKITQQPIVKVSAGGLNFNIPVHDGFFNIKDYSVTSSQFIERMVPKFNKSLAILIDEEDRIRIINGQDPKLNRQLQVQILRQHEYTDIPQALFTQVVSIVKSEQEKIFSEQKELIQEILDNASDLASKKVDQPIDIKMSGPPIPLGSFIETDRVYGFVSIFNAQVTVQRATIELSQIVATSVVHVKNRVLYVMVARKNEADAIDWCKQTSRDWVGAILQAN